MEGARDAAAVEEEDEEAGPERQQVGRGAAAGLVSQRPLEEGLEAGASGARGRGRAGEAAGGPER